MDTTTDPLIPQPVRPNMLKLSVTGDSFKFPLIPGQYRNDSDKFELSESASASREEVDFTEERYNIFGKLSFDVSPQDSLVFTYFLDYFDIKGDRNKNLVKSSIRQMVHMASMLQTYGIIAQQIYVDFIQRTWKNS